MKCSCSWIQLAQTVSVIVGKPDVILRIDGNSPDTGGIWRVIFFCFTCRRIDSYKLSESKYTYPNLILRIHFDIVKFGTIIKGCRRFSRDVIPSFDRIFRISGGGRNLKFLELLCFQIKFQAEFPEHQMFPSESTAEVCVPSFLSGILYVVILPVSGSTEAKSGPFVRVHPDKSIFTQHTSVGMWSGVFVEFFWADSQTVRSCWLEVPVHQTKHRRVRQSRCYAACSPAPSESHIRELSRSTPH